MALLVLVTSMLLGAGTTTGHVARYAPLTCPLRLGVCKAAHGVPTCDTTAA